MVRIKLFLSATCLITQYFALNITILHAVFVCVKWKRGFYDLYICSWYQAEELLFMSIEIDG